MRGIAQRPSLPRQIQNVCERESQDRPLASDQRALSTSQDVVSLLMHSAQACPALRLAELACVYYDKRVYDSFGRMHALRGTGFRLILAPLFRPQSPADLVYVSSEEDGRYSNSSSSSSGDDAEDQHADVRRR